MDSDSAPQRVQQCRLDLKLAAARAYTQIKASGFSSGQVAVATRLSDATVRRLGSDGDRGGWRPPSARVCAAVDEFGRAKLGVDFGLTPRREQLDLAIVQSGRSAEHRRLDEYVEDLAEAESVAWRSELVAYLHGLVHSLSETVRWLPHARLEDAYQERFVRVMAGPPETTTDGLYSITRLPRGDVSWTQAIKGNPLSVVLADAGFGKTWLLRHFTIGLARAALAEIEAGVTIHAVRIPLWTHARDLADQWNTDAAPTQRVADAGIRVLARSGVGPLDTARRALADLLARRTAQLQLIVDAYDEIFDDARREQVGQALRWLALTGGHRIVLSSRPAGYADPFERGLSRASDEDDEDDEDEGPRYLLLGVLDEPQVRQLWQRWFDARRRPVPLGRLESVLAPHSPLRQFVGVPLIAAFCAWVAEAEPVATHRTGLYAQVVRRFLAQSWKATDPSSGGSLRQDGARRVKLEASLTELAWHMASSSSWRDMLPASACEDVLAASGAPTVSDRSHLWEPVRQIGILVQDGAGPDGPLGDGPVMWIHRSVHEFLAARRLITAPPPSLSALLERCWFHPAWGNVLDFALGLETDGDGGTPLHSELARAATDGRDGLGWFATVLAAADHRGGPVGPLLDRIWRLHRAGLLSAPHLARALSFTPGVDHAEVVTVLTRRLGESGADLDLWEAMAWAGAPGRAALDVVIRTAPDTHSATTALYRVDPTAAVAAIEARIAADLPCAAGDADAFRAVGPATCDLLVRRYLDDPASVRRAETLAYTRSPTALATLGRTDLLTHTDPAIRLAAASGLAQSYGNDIDETGLEQLLELAVRDPSRQVRMRLRTILETVGLSVPWVERALREVFADLHHDPDEPDLDDLDAIAARLVSVGPGTRLVVTMLEIEPRLLRGPVREAMMGLAARALTGQLDAELTRDVARVVGLEYFLPLAVARITTTHDDPESLTNLALGICFAAPGDPRVFDALVSLVGRAPSIVLEAAMRMHTQPAQDRIEALANAMLALTTSDPRAVQTWSFAMRSLLNGLDDIQRPRLRIICAQATDHVLALSPA